MLTWDNSNMVVMVFNYVLTIAYSRPVSASLDFHHLCTFPQTVKVIHPKYYRSSTCPLTSLFWLLSHVIYLKKSFFFPKAVWWVAELLFLSQQLRHENECSQSSQIFLLPEKLRKMFTFQFCKFLNDKIKFPRDKL